MEQRLSMITLGVADLAASVRFYEDVVGWRHYKSGDDEEGIAFFQIGGMVFSLYPLDKLAEDVRVNAEGGGFRGCGLSYNARSEAEVDEIFASPGGKGRADRKGTGEGVLGWLQWLLCRSRRTPV